MSEPRATLFLERRGYRRRRLLDAARFLPFFGGALFAVPLLWPRPDLARAGEEPVSMSGAMLYIFGIWAILIVLAMLFGHQTRRWDRAEARANGEPH